MAHLPASCPFDVLLAGPAGEAAWDSRRLEAARVLMLDAALLATPLDKRAVLACCCSTAGAGVEADGLVLAAVSSSPSPSPICRSVQP